MFVLASQIMRAADAVSLTIAKGFTGKSTAEFNRFLGIVLRSDIEVAGCLYLTKRRVYINENDFSAHLLCEEILAMINPLRNSLP